MLAVASGRSTAPEIAPTEPSVDRVYAAQVATSESDFDLDGSVNGDDLVNEWKPGFGANGDAVSASGDADADGDVDGADILVWQRQLGELNPSSPGGPPDGADDAVGNLVAPAAAEAVRNALLAGDVMPDATDDANGEDLVTLANASVVHNQMGLTKFVAKASSRRLRPRCAE